MTEADEKRLVEIIARHEFSDTIEPGHNDIGVMLRLWRRSEEARASATQRAEEAERERDDANRLFMSATEKLGNAITERDKLRAVAREAAKEATIAWSVCASIHREYAKGLDPMFTTRQGDFVKGETKARAALSALDEPQEEPR